MRSQKAQEVRPKLYKKLLIQYCIRQILLIAFGNMSLDVTQNKVKDSQGETHSLGFLLDKISVYLEFTKYSFNMLEKVKVDFIFQFQNYTSVSNLSLF